MPFTWSPKSEQAAELLAGGLSITKTAKRVEVDEKTIDRWKRQPEFRTRLEERLAAIRTEIRTGGLAVRENRIAAERRRHGQIMAFVRKRAGNPRLGGVEGDDSGFFIRREKSLHVGEQAYERIEEIELDTAVTTELRELEQAIATEVGDWKTKVEHSGKIETVSQEALLLAELFEPAELERALTRAEQIAAKEPVQREPLIDIDPGSPASTGT